MKIVIHWRTKDAETRRKIRQRFGIEPHINVNGESVADIPEKDLPLLKETERRGYIDIRNKKPPEISVPHLEQRRNKMQQAR